MILIFFMAPFGLSFYSSFKQSLALPVLRKKISFPLLSREHQSAQRPPEKLLPGILGALQV